MNNFIKIIFVRYGWYTIRSLHKLPIISIKDLNDTAAVLGNSVDNEEMFCRTNPPWKKVNYPTL